MPNERAGGSPEWPPEGGHSGEGDLVEEGFLMPGPLGGDKGTPRDMRERWRYNADDAEVGGRGNGH